MIGLQLGALSPGRIDPERGHTETLQVVQLALDALERATDKAISCRHPRGFVSRGKLTGLLVVEHGALRFLAVAEAIRQQLIEYLIAPTARARENAPARGEVGRSQGSRRLFFNRCVSRHDLSVVRNSVSGDTAVGVEHLP